MSHNASTSVSRDISSCMNAWLLQSVFQSYADRDRILHLVGFCKVFLKVMPAAIGFIAAYFTRVDVVEYMKCVLGWWVSHPPVRVVSQLVSPSRVVNGRSIILVAAIHGYYHCSLLHFSLPFLWRLVATTLVILKEARHLDVNEDNKVPTIWKLLIKFQLVAQSVYVVLLVRIQQVQSEHSCWSSAID